MVIALLAPEFIVYNAWSQRQQAKRVMRLLRQRSGQGETRTLLSRWLKRLATPVGIVDTEKGSQHSLHASPEAIVLQKDHAKVLATIKVFLTLVRCL